MCRLTPSGLEVNRKRIQRLMRILGIEAHYGTNLSRPAPDHQIYPYLLRGVSIALPAALRFGQPEIWNSDQGFQFTSPDFLASLQKRGVLISMDGHGRALDNVFIERLWRSLKYELIYPGDSSAGSP